MICSPILDKILVKTCKEMYTKCKDHLYVFHTISHTVRSKFAALTDMGRLTDASEVMRRTGLDVPQDWFAPSSCSETPSSWY